MKKSEAVRLFGTAPNMATWCKVTHQAIYKAPEELPRSLERKVRKALADFLAVAGPARVAVAACLLGMLLQSFPVAAQTVATCDQRTNGPWTDIRATWAAPTQNTDGSAVSGAVTYRVSRQIGSGAWAVQCQTTERTATVWNTGAGTYNLRVTATVGGQESAPSGTATVVLVAPVPVPRAPSSLVIVIPVAE